MTFKKRSKQFQKNRQPERRKPVQEGHWIFGRNPVFEILNWAPARIIEVYAAIGGQADNRATDLIQKLKNEMVPVQKADFDTITKLVGSDSHQGFAARLKDKKALDLEDIISTDTESPSCLLLVDGVQDPQNLGAMLRAAECLGVAGVVWSKNRTVGLTPVVSKASAGASEIVKTVAVSNLLQCIERLKKEDYWIVGAVADPSAVALSKFDFPKKTAIVMGSEGSGMQQAIEAALDFKVYIPMQGRVDSLNVSQATAVFLYAWMVKGWDMDRQS